MKKIVNIIVFLLIAGLIVILFLTNPNEADIHKQVKEKEGCISWIEVSKRGIFLLFSIYQVDFIISTKHSKSSYAYLGIFGRAVELTDVETNQ